MDLLRRYDKPGPRYTSYPTAVEFAESYTNETYHDRLAEADELAGAPLSLYVHLPFCEERCTYCGCNVVITKKRQIAAEYLDRLHKEVEMLAARLPHRRKVTQYHWGGGTPTYLEPDQMEALQRKVTEHFQLEPGAEVAIEVDPRVTTREQLERLSRIGFNRVSLGVQDLDPKVQEAIGRNQSEAQTRGLYETAREIGFPSINMDLVYGLPEQTTETFTRTVDTIAEMRPDRIALYSYAHLPSIKAHQKRIDENALPAPDVKLRLFCIARETLLAAGYAAIGMDHFALPDDELVRAIDRRALHRNFMGYTVKSGADMVGLGLTAIGDVAGSFAQNVRKLSRYYEAIDAGRLAIERGYLLNADDLLRRDVITNLMCNFYLDKREVERRHGIVFDEYFADELADLAAADGPVEHGFVEVGTDAIEVVGHGRLFVRNVCMIFDRFIREKLRSKQTFSRTV
jgi:oxygen-independent coproporphyrinogen-3 oxidase